MIKKLDEKDKKINEFEQTIYNLKIELKNEKDKNNNLLIQIEKEKNLSNDLSNEIKKYKLMTDNLNKKIQELQGKIHNQSINNQNNSNKIIELYKEIHDLNEKLKRYPFILEKGERLISVIFSSVDQQAYYSMICKNTDTIHDLEKNLYKEYPHYSCTENFFLFKGKIINRFQSFESNGINNGDVIVLNQKNDE